MNKQCIEAVQWVTVTCFRRVVLGVAVRQSDRRQIRNLVALGYPQSPSDVVAERPLSAWTPAIDDWSLDNVQRPALEINCWPPWPAIKAICSLSMRWLVCCVARWSLVGRHWRQALVERSLDTAGRTTRGGQDTNQRRLISRNRSQTPSAWQCRQCWWCYLLSGDVSRSHRRWPSDHKSRQMIVFMTTRARSVFDSSWTFLQQVDRFGRCAFADLF